jgi:aspartate dehydrogenase
VKTEMKTLGLIGCGAIGTLIAEACAKNIVECDKIVLYDFDQQKAEKLKKSLRFPTVLVASVSQMIKLQPTIIVEAASQQAAKDYAKMIIDANIQLIIMSTGALLDLNVDLRRINVPSGAIGGLDALGSAALAGISEVTLTSRKNPKAFELSNKEAKTMYEGYAEDAARLFPREMNVAATLALTVKPARVKVQVISDPEVSRNTHEIRVKWKYGEMFMRFANDPHPDNPHTSALAAWSALKLIRTLLHG